MGVAAALMVKEPARADVVMQAKAGEAKAHPLRGAYDAVVGPFIEFFTAHGFGLALLMLTMITTFHLCDYMRGPMSNPFYLSPVSYTHLTSPTS